MIRTDLDAGASVFGKVPTRGDFFHSGLHGSAELAFSTWLSSAIEHSEGVTPPGPVRFFVAPPQDDTLVGTWVASRDTVGRSFPLAASCRVPRDVEDVQWQLVLGYYARFMLEAERLLGACAEAEQALLDQTPNQLPLPHPSLLPGLWQNARQALGSERTQAFALRNLKGEPLAAWAYALDTLQRAAALDDPELTLDMPVGEDADVFAWLELLSASLGAERKPHAVFWSPSTHRLLVGVGALSVQLLAFLNQPDHRSNRRWPVWTERADAAQLARSALGRELVEALERNATLAQLVSLMRAGATP